MACTNCGTAKPAGCRSNGGCATGGCNKMNVFDWLSHLDIPPDEPFNVVEVRFKNGKKEFFRNSEGFALETGDPVVVEMPTGYHIGYVSLRGELVRLQMRKQRLAEDAELPRILRLPTEADMQKFQEAKNREMPTLFRTREIIRELGMQMKLNDVEYQADQTKATFYYTADGRVDFRELIKILASEFKIRVEMRQISLRQEAARLGGIGVCGRELCCSTWLSDFKSVATSAARYQNLSLNPAKLSGQCGRLKCCLNYELDTYVEALKDIPQVEVLKTAKGDAYLRKTDIFKKILWFSYENESTWYPLSVERVREIMKMNEEGQMPELLQETTLLDDDEAIEEAIENDISTDLERVEVRMKESEDAKPKKKRRKKSKNRKKQQEGNGKNTTRDQAQKSEASNDENASSGRKKRNYQRRNNNRRHDKS
jgi:cell fate regulator YaaT (PSP1 superfamily)